MDSEWLTAVRFSMRRAVTCYRNKRLCMARVSA
jgi:hypothetical protein